jgi:dihydropteroate synthase
LARYNRWMAYATSKQFLWQLRTRALQLGERPLCMAIVNLTPDSFSGDGLLSLGTDAAVAAAIAALDAGADIVDLGAESTRPNATPLTAEDEQARLLPALKALLAERPTAIISVDTYHAATARAAASAGAEIINDVSGLGWDPGMAAAVAETGCGFVLMHTRGRPGEWDTQTRLRDDEVMPCVLEGLREQLAQALSAGIAAERIVLDPGFGFGKRGAENFVLLDGLVQLHTLGRPLLIGLSRKGFLAPELRPAERGPATEAAHAKAIAAGAHILRVHDVRPTQNRE